MAVGAFAELRGVPRVLARLKVAGVLGSRLTADELRSTAEKIAAQSRRLVPVDTGALRNSIQVKHDHGSGKLVSEIGAGDTAVDYAVRQHEDTTLRHPGQGQAKYIETPFRAALDGFEDRLSSRITRAMRAV